MDGQKLQDDIFNVCTWLQKWQLLFNIKQDHMVLRTGFRGQRSRSRSKGSLNIEEVYPIKQLTKYGRDPIRDKKK